MPQFGISKLMEVDQWTRLSGRAHTKVAETS